MGSGSGVASPSDPLGVSVGSGVSSWGGGDPEPGGGDTGGGEEGGGGGEEVGSGEDVPGGADVGGDGSSGGETLGVSCVGVDGVGGAASVDVGVGAAVSSCVGVDGVAAVDVVLGVAAAVDAVVGVAAPLVVGVGVTASVDVGVGAGIGSGGVESGGAAPALTWLADPVVTAAKLTTSGPVTSITPLSSGAISYTNVKFLPLLLESAASLDAPPTDMVSETSSGIATGPSKATVIGTESPVCHAVRPSG